MQFPAEEAVRKILLNLFARGPNMSAVERGIDEMTGWIFSIARLIVNGSADKCSAQAVANWLYIVHVEGLEVHSGSKGEHVLDPTLA